MIQSLLVLLLSPCWRCFEPVGVTVERRATVSITCREIVVYTIEYSIIFIKKIILCIFLDESLACCFHRRF